MNAAASRRFVAIAGAVAVVTTITTAPTTAKVEEGSQDRPCFMVRPTWNNAEGPLPTCPNGRFKKTVSEDAGGASRPVPSPRISDFMP